MNKKDIILIVLTLILLFLVLGPKRSMFSAMGMNLYNGPVQIKSGPRVQQVDGDSLAINQLTV